MVLVVGGGAAGMMAAGTAALRGKEVTLLERNERVGRKIRITGKGRCNVTNQCGCEEFLANVPTNPKFLYGALRRFAPEDAIAFFQELGVPLKTERGNRVFPVSDCAADVAAALEEFCRSAGVQFRQARIERLECAGGGVSALIDSDGRRWEGDRVVLATGGLSYPRTGSTGDGYRLAQSAGHTITPLRPSLVPLVSSDPACGELQGLSLRNVEVSLLDRGKAVYRELGEMLFTHFGLSGPLILSASAHIPQMEPDRWRIRIDLKPGLDDRQLDSRIRRDFEEFANRDFRNSLEKLLPRKLIPLIVERSGIPPFAKVNQITREQRQGLCGLLKGLEFPVDAFRPIEEAIITSGGVSTKEVNPSTMESKLVKGLFFAGELLDVDGYTGGFNLQIAFSTGRLAGMNV